MKHFILTIVIAAMLIAAVLNANPVIYKPHKGMTGKDSAKVNCVYCHKTASIPKVKGNDVEKLKKAPTCAMKDCH